MSDDSPSLSHDPLSIIEARVLGSLIEKDFTSPDHYPLSLNALVNACNQKSNRSPVMDLDGDAVDRSVESLRLKHFAHLVSQAGSRVAKFKHSFAQVYPSVSNSQRAILAELLLRGPQTPGELRTRCERMAAFSDLEAVKAELGKLASQTEPLVKELPRQPGKKDARFAHLLSGEPAAETPAPANDAPLRVEVAAALPEEAKRRIEALEEQVQSQAEQLEQLQQAFESFRAQFD